ncbi:DUF5060 domain-containing protein [Lacihabitans lacunae]|uniref:DUF5060 domain-containing protein n=1 Tax=Lacihabitans lacunae TaxID=1028214 RepID=A0ABV7YZ01_9BACT
MKHFASALLILVASCCISMSSFAQKTQTTEQWGVFEISLKGPSEGNPYMDNSLEATFSNGNKTVLMPGFYDGNGMYKIRFSPDQLGKWSFVTNSNQAALNNRKGTFTCVKPTGNNHGPVKIVNTFYLKYADGSPFYSVGTTAYQWTSVKQSIQEQTIKTLEKAPFNKMRMCVFPKNYRFGNDTEPWMLAYKKVDDKNDPTQPNYEFFQNFDHRVEQLLAMGIQADVILFHPYDILGYFLMGKEMNEKYTRYMIARLSAYRNVWWSLANEWDIPRIKDAIDWEGVGSLLQKEDPYQRLRSIHNWAGDETHFYDHTRPWITHVSTQTHRFFDAIKWRNQYQKPVFFDEMRYEGDVASSWGQLTGKEMTSYFWKAGLSGVYGMHGETLRNDSDKETEVRWWAKGGTLMGESEEKIAFFRKIMEAAPVTEMTPEMLTLTKMPKADTLVGKIDPKLMEVLNNNIYTLYQKDKYYLVYTTDPLQTIELNLGGNKDYTLEVIDTWNMKVGPKKTVSPGKFQFKTETPFTAIRLISQ